MKRPLDVVVQDGLYGGLLAGAVVAVWFFAADAIAGAPFRTPAVLAYLFFHRDTLSISVELVTFYTILHLGVFAALGVATAWVLAVFDAPASLLKGAAFGILVLDLVFYSALLWTGARILGVLPWPHVLGSNILGGMALMTYLHRASHDQRPFGLSVLRGHPLANEGAVTGLVGAAAVALWFFALDAAAGQPLRTPAALGSALFLGAQGIAETRTGLGVVAGYTVVHVAVFIAIGIGLAWLTRQVERTPQFLLLVVLACIVLEALVVAAMALTAEWVLGTLGWWSVVVGNLFAVGCMAAWIWRRHPVLRNVLQRPIEVRT